MRRILLLPYFLYSGQHVTVDIPALLDQCRSQFPDGKPIVCDGNMLKAGMTKIRNEILCAVDWPEAAALAQADQSACAAAAMTHLAPRLEEAIVAIGNAPTALGRILELTRNGGPRPALVVGLPIGFVGVQQSKRALLKSDLCYITNTNHRGGSPAAAASINVLALMASGG